MKLAIVGASYLQRPLVKKAKEMGIETHVFAWEEGNVVKDIADYFYPVSILDKEEILAICTNLKVDGIISIASDLAMHAVNYVADALGLIGNSLECTFLTTDKFAMREALSAGGVKCPKFRLFSESSKMEEGEFVFPVIVKPTDRSGSRGITKVGHQGDLEAAVSFALNDSISKRVIVEEFVLGSEYSIESVSKDGVHKILAITEKQTTGAPHFVELEHHQPAPLSSSNKDKIKKLVVKALSALKVEHGASHTEVLLTEEDEVFCVEVGARMGGDFIGSHLVELSTGIDFVKLVIEISLNDKVDFDYEEGNYTRHAGIHFLTADRLWVKAVIDDNPEYVVQSELEDRVGTQLHNSSDRSGYFIYANSSKKIENLAS